MHTNLIVTIRYPVMVTTAQKVENGEFLLGSIICDSYYMTFFDSFLIVKLPPDIFYFSPSVSHRQ